MTDGTVIKNCRFSDGASYANVDGATIECRSPVFNKYPGQLAVGEPDTRKKKHLREMFKDAGKLY